MSVFFSILFHPRSDAQRKFLADVFCPKRYEVTVMIRFSARGTYLLLVPQGRALIRDRALIIIF